MATTKKGSTNFLIFNEENSADKTYTDSEYKNASQRVSGVTPGMALSRLHNKLFLQCSAFACAFSKFLNNQGYDAYDNQTEELAENIEKAIKTFMTGTVSTEAEEITQKLTEHNDSNTAHAAAFEAHNADNTAHEAAIKAHNDSSAAHANAFKAHNADTAAHQDFTGATASKDGIRGMVPAPTKGQQAGYYLCADGSWHLALPEGGTADKVLSGAGTWVDGGINLLKRNKAYVVGDIAYSPKLPSWAYLECTTAGTTDGSEPDALSTVTGSSVGGNG